MTVTAVNGAMKSPACDVVEAPRPHQAPMPLPHQKPAFGSRHPPKWHFQCSSSQGCCEVPPLRTVTGKQLEGWDALQDRRVHAVRRLPGLGGPLPRGLGSHVETRAVPLVALPLISSVVSMHDSRVHLQGCPSRGTALLSPPLKSGAQAAVGGCS